MSVVTKISHETTNVYRKLKSNYFNSEIQIPLYKRVVFLAGIYHKKSYYKVVHC